eukprot:gene14694-17361_t
MSAELAIDKFSAPGEGLQVIGAGAGRTGTTSLKLALEILYKKPCYHFDTITKEQNFHHAPLWTAIYKGLSRDFHPLMDGKACAVDWPASYFYKELMEAYPEAKVVLTTRDADAWYTSTVKTIYAFKKEVGPLWLARIPGAPLHKVVGMATTVLWEGVMEGKMEDKEAAKARFLQLNERVKEHVPAEKLLVFEVKEGWEPLCKFLGKESNKSSKKDKKINGKINGTHE